MAVDRLHRICLIFSSARPWWLVKWSAVEIVWFRQDVHLIRRKLCKNAQGNSRTKCFPELCSAKMDTVSGQNWCDETVAWQSSIMVARRVPIKNTCTKTREGSAYVCPTDIYTLINITRVVLTRVASAHGVNLPSCIMVAQWHVS